MDPLIRYLIKHINRPTAAVNVFGGTGLIAGAASGFQQGGGFEGAAVLGFVGGVVGAICGLFIGLIAWLICRLLGGLDRHVKHPELWAWALECSACGWHTKPQGRWTLRDCLAPPDSCPVCHQRLRMRLPICPRCGVYSNGPIRWPKGFRQAMWGGYTCRNCSCDFDKWDRAALDATDHGQLTTDQNPSLPIWHLENKLDEPTHCTDRHGLAGMDFSSVPRRRNRREEEAYFAAERVDLRIHPERRRGEMM